MHLSSRVAVAALAAASLTAVLVPGASASGGSGDQVKRPWHRTLTTDVLFPFQLAVNSGHVWVADGATQTVSEVVNGHLFPVAHGLPGKGSDVAGLDVSAAGTSFAYTSSVANHSLTTLTIRTVGKPDVVADLAAYEASANPDSATRYGLQDSSNSCARQFFRAISGGPAMYQGHVDSHPYGVASLGGGAWAVADAGGNDILKVTANGNISTIAVLPPQLTTFTEAQVAALGAPPCIVGETYAFEPVPTDVEVGPGGALYVTSLPGGPEDPSLGARGSVLRIGAGGSVTQVAGGFLGATNLALAPDGSIFVTEFFAGKVTKIRPNGLRTVLGKGANPVSVEVSGGYAYVGHTATFGPTGITAPGSIDRYLLDLSGSRS